MESPYVRYEMKGSTPPDDERIRAAEVVAALSLATDLGIGVPMEHGLHSTLIAMRLIERAGIDADVASQTYFACLLFYVGCTANADLADELFGGHDVLTKYGGPVRFGSRPQMVTGVLARWPPRRACGPFERRRRCRASRGSRESSGRRRPPCARSR